MVWFFFRAGGSQFVKGKLNASTFEFTRNVARAQIVFANRFRNFYNINSSNKVFLKSIIIPKKILGSYICLALHLIFPKINLKKL